jgi:hypothetical protein
MSPAIRFSKLRQPSIAILKNTLPMGMFQVGGHIFSSIAISRIPVSTVHTIKVGCNHLHSPSECSCPFSGIITFIHSRRLQTALRRKLLEQDLHFLTSFDDRSHAGMFFRCFGF